MDLSQRLSRGFVQRFGGIIRLPSCLFQRIAGIIQSRQRFGSIGAQRSKVIQDGPVFRVTLLQTVESVLQWLRSTRSQRRGTQHSL